MKDKIGIAIATIALILACSLPAFAGHGFAVRQQVVVQRVRVQRVFVPRQRVVVQRVVVPHVQQFVAPQAFYAPQLQLNSGCYQGGGLQLNAGVGCSSLYR